MVGIALTALVLVPVFSISPLSGALIEISFEGGPGTAAGLEPLFEELGFSEGADLAIGLTCGLRFTGCSEALLSDRLGHFLELNPGSDFGLA